MDDYTLAVKTLYRAVDKLNGYWSSEASAAFIENGCIVNNAVKDLSERLIDRCEKDYQDIEANSVRWELIAQEFISEAHKIWQEEEERRSYKKERVKHMIDQVYSIAFMPNIWQVVLVWNGVCDVMRNAHVEPGDSDEKDNTNPVHQKFLDRIQEIHKAKKSN